MPHLDINGTSLFYNDEGQGRETLVFAHGLLFSSKMFRAQIDYFKEHYRCISIDFKGQGQSGISSSGYDMDTLTTEVLAILDQLNIDQFHFAGLSMGGFVGLRLAVSHPERLKSLILLNTTAWDEPKENIPKYSKLNFVARWFGLKLVINKVMPILFADPFLTDPDRKEDREFWKAELVSNHRIGITKAVKGVIYRNGIDQEINKIKTPTLILSGEFDSATVPEYSRKMNEQIQSSEWKVIPGAGHSSTIENPQKVIENMDGFLKNIRSSSEMQSSL